MIAIGATNVLGKAPNVNEPDADVLGAVYNLNAEFQKTNNRKRIAQVITFGCKMNDNDSEKIKGLLVKMGFIIEPSRTSGKFGNPAPLGALGELNTYEPDDGARQMPDIVLLNTCCVRDNAEQRFYGILGSLKKYKSDDPSRVLAVCGCMAQENNTVENIQSKYNHVDFIFGTKAISTLPSLLLDAYMKRGSDFIGAKKHREILVMNDLDNAEIEDRLPMHRKPPPLALVSIMNGCENFCSYCIVPYVRGRERSRSPESIVKEVEQLATEGYREITLLGQNVNSYCSCGADLNDYKTTMSGNEVTFNENQFTNSKYCDFAGLLAKLDAIEGIWRIRFMTSHPKNISDKIIYALRDLNRVCPQLHLPVQSGSTAILEKMNRGYSRERYLEIVQKIRDAIPDITLTTDIIVGFPGESDADFDETLSLVETASFDLAYTFIFSPREGTSAAKLIERVPDDIIKKRFERLLALQNRISFEKNNALLGECCEVLCEGVSKTNSERYTGRTPGGKVVNFAPKKHAANNPAGGGNEYIGKLIQVRIEKAGTWSLDGTAI